MQTEKRVFYGWGIVAASVIILAVALGMFNSTNSVFVIPVCESLGLSRSEFTLYRTVMTLASACAMPFYGKIIGRLGVKKTLLIGAVALSAITACYSFANSLWHFYILAFFNGIFFNAVNFMSIGILVSSWFEDRRGFATGLAYSGSGIGGAIMIPVVTQVIELAGWRFAYRFMGIVGAVILIPVILLLIRDTPEKKGLKPYTTAKSAKDERKSSMDTAFNLSLSESLRTGRFWLLAVSFLFISVFTGAMNTHSTPFLTDLGYPTAMVSAVISLLMLFLTVGKIILGSIYDRFGSLAGNIFVAVCCLIFPVAALLSHIPVFPWVYAVAVGMASCGLSVPVSVLVVKYFGVKDYPTIFSIFTMITTLGPSVSVPAMGAVYDSTGSYMPAFAALLVFSVIIAVCMVGAEMNYRRKTSDR